MRKKGLIGKIQRFSTEDGPGIRSTVFLKGCPLNCAWCHNPELIEREPQPMFRGSRCIACGACAGVCEFHALSMEPGAERIRFSECRRCFRCAEVCFSGALEKVGLEMDAGQVVDEVLADKRFYAKTGGGVTLSGGEALAQANFAEELIRLCGEKGVSVILDTSGFGDTEALLRMAAGCSHILFDMKAVDDKVHRTYTGRGNGLILKNLRELAASDALRPKLWMRMPLVHGVNDGEEMITETAELYRELGLGRVSLLPYHRLGNGKAAGIGKEMESFEPPSESRLEEIKTRFAGLGMQVEVLGQ